MKRHLNAASLLVRNYDEAIAFFTEKLGFTLTEDTDLGNGKRWVIVHPIQIISIEITVQWQRPASFFSNHREKKHMGKSVSSKTYQEIAGIFWNLW